MIGFFIVYCGWVLNYMPQKYHLREARQYGKLIQILDLATLLKGRQSGLVVIELDRLKWGKSHARTNSYTQFWFI